MFGTIQLQLAQVKEAQAEKEGVLMDQISELKAFNQGVSDQK